MCGARPPKPARGSASASAGERVGARGGRRAGPLAGLPARRVHAPRRDRPAGDARPGAPTEALDCGVVIHERTRVRARRRRQGGRRSRRRRAEGAGLLVAGQVVVGPQRLGRRLAPVRPAARHMVELHRPDRANPGSPRGDRLDRRRRRRRLAVHAPLRADDARRADRARRRRRAGRARRPDRLARSPTTRAARAAPRRGCGAGSRALADVRIDDAWGGPIDITDDHRPWFGTLPGGRVHYGVGLLRERRRAGGPRRPDPGRARRRQARR